MGQLERALAKLGERQPKAKKNGSGSIKTSRSAGYPETAVEQPLPAGIREIPLDQNRLQTMRVIVDGSETTSAPYKMLRTRVLQRMGANGWKTLAISSPRSNSGKTLTSINMAITLAQDPNQQVCLVDLDLRNPRIASYLGIKTSLGLSDYFAGNASLDKIMVRSEIPRLVIIPNQKALKQSSEMLVSAKMSDLIDAVSKMSTIVIFDLPPLLEADDMVAFAPRIDAALIIVAQGQTQRADLEKTGDLIKDMTILGTVLNKSDEANYQYY